MELKKDKLLQNGKYRIEGVLGQGGFGITYLAVQVGLNRKVAVKESYMKEYCERNGDASTVSMGTSGSRELVDGFGDYSSGSQTNPAGPSTGSNRVDRGGSRNSFARRCRVSYRDYCVPDGGFSYLGLRLCLYQY